MDDDGFHLGFKKKQTPSLNSLSLIKFLCFFKTIFISGSNSGTLRKEKSGLL